MTAETEHEQARHVPVTGHVWLNGQRRPMATLTFPDGSKAILAIPHRDRAGDPDSSQAYRAAIAALASVPASGDTSARPA